MSVAAYSCGLHSKPLFSKPQKKEAEKELKTVKRSHLRNSVVKLKFSYQLRGILGFLYGFAASAICLLGPSGVG